MFLNINVFIYKKKIFNLKLSTTIRHDRGSSCFAKSVIIVKVLLRKVFIFRTDLFQFSMFQPMVLRERGSNQVTNTRIYIKFGIVQHICWIRLDFLNSPRWHTEFISFSFNFHGWLSYFWFVQVFRQMWNENRDFHQIAKNGNNLKSIFEPKFSMLNENRFGFWCVGSDGASLMLIELKIEVWMCEHQTRP